MLDPRRSVQEKLCLREQSFIFGVQQDFSHLVADGGSTRLPGQRNPQLLRGQVFRKQDDLCGLAGALDPFEGDEDSLHLRELRRCISGGLERGVRGKEDYLGLCPQSAKYLACGLLPCRIETGKRIIENQRQPPLARERFNQPDPEAEIDQFFRPVTQF
jgi:hypothetical protein